MEPYAMCSKQEFLERIRSHEISVFEKSNDGSPDPRKVITKYRRSTAGNQHHRTTPPRSMHQLSITVHYLVRLLAYSFEEDDGTCFVPAVHFFEDRIRAVQVDFTRSSSSVTRTCNCDSKLLAKLQVMIARAQILILYLMSSMVESPLLLVSDSSSSSSTTDHQPLLQYESKFGRTALQTALSSYCASFGTFPCQDEWNDQMIAFSILSLVNELLLLSSNNHNNIATGLGHVWMEVTLLARKYGVFGPRTHRAVTFLVTICRGEWQQAIRHLDMDDSTNWTMEQYCIDHVARGYLRWNTLQTLNMVLSKGQGIHLDEVARLLSIDDNNRRSCDHAMDRRRQRQTVDFVTRFGLPISDTGSNVIFKKTEMLPPSNTPSKRCGNASGCAHPFGNWKPKLSMLQLILDGFDETSVREICAMP